MSVTAYTVTAAAINPEIVSERLGSIAFMLRGERYPFGSEIGLQNAIEATFRRFGLVFEREKRLGPGDIVDFYVPVLAPPGAAPPHGIAVEVKLHGGRRDVYRQCERYCLHPDVVGLVLATVRPGALPPIIAGKPARVVDLGRAWL
ncbi:hypothetical protein [Rhodoplanes roseus]|uniref:DUF4143 domain-containing protein n=1 Tax=Rhodoplanes roseus TaxID=29409 RepID=A0A327L5X3_9BRAD|nr:hypothetical protein [Rhodoplanes roseus]RAI45273.1 hypothetical protein CH341_04995 [Rhodoplanes roseus]